MKCKYCGAEYDGGSYCPNCGSNNSEYKAEEPIFEEKEEEKVFINQEPPKAEEANADCRPGKNKIIAALFAILFGGIGLQCFYLGRIARGVFSILFCWTGIPELVGLIEGIIIIVGSDKDFEERYNVKCIDQV